MAELTGALDKADYSANSILDDVYQGLFQRFNSQDGQLERLKTWVYQIADMILEEVLQEQLFEQNHSLQLTQLQDKELSELEELYTIDADGELTLLEDLDDEVYNKQYDALSIVEDASMLEAMERILISEDRKVLHQEIRKILIQMPELERTVFDLFWLGEMQLDQIADIRNLTFEQTKLILENTTLQVKRTLEYRLNPDHQQAPDVDNKNSVS